LDVTRVVVLALLALAVSFSPSAANVGDCLRAYRGFERGTTELVELSGSCAKLASGGNKTALKFMGTAHYAAGHYAQAKPWLLRAAHQGDISAPFLLAGIYAKAGQRKIAATWAYRGHKRAENLRQTTRSSGTRFLDLVVNNAYQLVGTDLEALVAEGHALEDRRVALSNPFVGRWKIGPNENCRSYYTEITAQGAAFFFAGRHTAYDLVRFDLPHSEVTLINGSGALTLRVMDANTLQVVRVLERASNKAKPSGVLATRCV
jgi:hypothetical protein